MQLFMEQTHCFLGQRHVFGTLANQMLGRIQKLQRMYKLSMISVSTAEGGGGGRGGVKIVNGSFRIPFNYKDTTWGFNLP